MPIYEFRCLSCNHCFELLSVRKDDTLEMKCPSCEGEEVERVLSCVSYVMGSSSSSGDSDKTKVTTKSCGGGSCGIIDILRWSQQVIHEISGSRSYDIREILEVLLRNGR